VRGSGAGGELHDERDRGAGDRDLGRGDGDEEVTDFVDDTEVVAEAGLDVVVDALVDTVDAGFVEDDTVVETLDPVVVVTALLVVDALDVVVDALDVVVDALDVVVDALDVVVDALVDVTVVETLVPPVVVEDEAAERQRILSR
jgi:hypothetical protein